jgi:hypothetical protein
MLTVEQCKKLGIRYVDLSEETLKIDFYQQELLQKLQILKNSTPKFSLPPTNLNFSYGSPGQIAVDDEYIYICNQDGIWRRIKLNE